MDQTTSKIEEMMQKQTRRSPGRAKVAGMLLILEGGGEAKINLVCGISKFSNSIREIVLGNMQSNKDITFEETEFQPKEVIQAYPGIHTIPTGDVEMGPMSADNIREGRMRLTQPQGAVETPPRLNLRRKSKTSQDDSNRLIKSHSGTSSRLETLPESESESDTDTDIEYLMIENLGNRREANVKEIV